MASVAEFIRRSDNLLVKLMLMMSRLGHLKLIVCFASVSEFNFLARNIRAHRGGYECRVQSFGSAECRLLNEGFECQLILDPNFGCRIEKIGNAGCRKIPLYGS